MQRLRIRYTKEGRVRFVSARDLTSVWERSLRRAGLPIAYSEGFHPHAKVSFPDALSVGYASTGEYAELTFSQDIDPAPDLALLSAALPEGMDITTYLVVPEGARKFARLLGATLWELVLDVEPSKDVAASLEQASAELLSKDQFEVTRHRPSGDTIVDLRASLVQLAASTRTDHGVEGVDGPRPVLRAVFDNTGPTVRPPDLHGALAQLAGPPFPDVRLIRRIAQGESVEGGLREALGQELEALVVDPLADAA